MAAAEDPFASVRAQWPEDKNKPFDLLDDDERDYAREQIVELYQKNAHDVTVKKGSQGQLASFLPLWEACIKSALIRNDLFLKIVVDEQVDPGTVDFGKVFLRKAWLEGLFLPKYYDVYQRFEEGYQSVLRGMENKIVQDARQAIIPLVQRCQGQTIEDLQ